MRRPHCTKGVLFALDRVIELAEQASDGTEDLKCQNELEHARRWVSAMLIYRGYPARRPKHPDEDPRQPCLF
jgi:hypothetical protein